MFSMLGRIIKIDSLLIFCWMFTFDLQLFMGTKMVWKIEQKDGLKIFGMESLKKIIYVPKREFLRKFFKDNGPLALRILQYCVEFGHSLLNSFSINAKFEKTINLQWQNKVLESSKSGKNRRLFDPTINHKLITSKNKTNLLFVKATAGIKESNFKLENITIFNVNESLYENRRFFED